MPFQTHVQARIKLIGRPPGLLLHSSELADETNKYAIQIAELVDASRGRRRLTDEQRAQKDYLQWRGALGTLYVREGSIVVPTTNLIRSVVTAARDFSLGTKIEDRGAVTFTEPELVIKHKHPRDTLEQLYKRPEYQLRIPVNPNPSARTKGLIPIMRPRFMPWESEIGAFVLTDSINWEQFQKIMETAGNVGIGNGRKVSYGRFNVIIEQVADDDSDVPAGPSAAR